MKRVSVRDVALEAGVTIGSVSKALNGGKHVSAALRARVRAAADKLGYQPNAQARGLRLGRSNTIGLLVNDVRHPMYMQIISAVESELSAQGRMLLLANAHADPAQEQAILRTFQRTALDGAILTASFHASPEEWIPSDTRLPLVLIDRDVEGYDRVCLERRDGMRTAVRHLLTLGHRRIALFTPALARVPGAERVAGFSDAFRQFGLPVDLRAVPVLASPLQDGFEPLAKLLDTPEPPTALVCLGTRLLSGALRALRARGLRVPQDFSVIAVGTPDQLDFADPPLTCLRTDLQEIGRSAAQLMLRRLSTPASANRPAERIQLEAELVVRDSCGPVVGARRRSR